MSDFLDRERPSSLVTFLARRWVRVVAVVWVLVTVGVVAVYQATVAPKLTADRLELWLVGSPERVVIGVDEDAGVVHVTGGQNGLSEMIVDDDSLFVLASEIDGNAPGATWVEVPLASLDPAFAAFEPARLITALSPGHVRCELTAGDAASVIRVLVKAPKVTGEGVSLCGAGAGAAADEGEDFFTSQRAVEPGDVDPGPLQSVASLSSLDEPDVVIGSLNELI